MEKYKIVDGNTLRTLAENVNREINDGFIPIGRAFEARYFMHQTMIHKSALKGLKEYFAKGVMESRGK